MLLVPSNANNLNESRVLPIHTHPATAVIGKIIPNESRYPVGYYYAEKSLALLFWGYKEPGLQAMQHKSGVPWGIPAESTTEPYFYFLEH